MTCNENKLKSLYVSKNSNLSTLYCGKNKLTSLDVSKNTALNQLNCSYNKLTSLDINTALTYLVCGNNQFDCDALKRKYGLN